MGKEWIERKKKKRNVGVGQMMSKDKRTKWTVGLY